MTVLSSPGAEDSPKAEVSHGFAADEACSREAQPRDAQGYADGRAGDNAETLSEIVADHSKQMAAPSASFLQPGKLIKGRYELQEQVGAGGLGAVWSARHLGLSSSVALKFLKPELSNHAEAVSRFSTEARACFVLRSEHVVRVLDVDSFEGVPFIVMELLDGTDLRQVLGALDPALPLSPSVVADYALQVCEGLCAAHGSGIIHRDIKPENLFLHGVGADACVKVLDFGISHVQAEYAREPVESSAARAAAGTPPYMSPEQLRAAEAVDARSDVWSLGCVLYELLTGIAPFERDSTAESCNAVLTLEPAPIAGLRADLPAGLVAVIERCLQKDASARYADASQLAAALVSFGSGSYADYPARCAAQLRGERRSSGELSALRDSQPPPIAAQAAIAAQPVAAADSSGEIALLTGTQSPLQRLTTTLRGSSARTLWLAGLGLCAAGVLLFAQTQQPAASSSAASASSEQHIVTPNPKASAARAREEGSAPVLHIESLLPAGASAELEQGRAAPRELDQSSAQATKHKARHVTRSSRYQRRHAQRDPDVGF